MSDVLALQCNNSCTTHPISPPISTKNHYPCNSLLFLSQFTLLQKVTASISLKVTFVVTAACVSHPRGFITSKVMCAHHSMWESQSRHYTPNLTQTHNVSQVSSFTMWYGSNCISRRV